LECNQSFPKISWAFDALLTRFCRQIVVAWFDDRAPEAHSNPHSALPCGACLEQGDDGHRMFAEGGDGRSAWGRRWRDLCLSHANDLGGADILSEAQVSLVKRASAIECELEAMEARLSEGQVIDIGQYVRLTGCLCRLFELIGRSRSTR
jgi:hypothetical protein